MGLENSLRIKLNTHVDKKEVRYRVFISEVGTTVSKVIKKIRFIILKYESLTIKVFIDIDPTNEDEQFFLLHGIHYVQVF